jgi:capsular polysaccharide transport system permease protein
MNFLQALTPRRLVIALIAAPLALAVIYFAFFASDRYVSESIVTVRQASDTGSAVPGIAMMLTGTNPPARDDTLYLRQYVHSLDMLLRLDQRLKLREHFRKPVADPLYRLPASADQEWFLDYYRNRVEVLFDDTASLLTIRVQGFDPAFAQTLNRAILEESERFVNAFSHKMSTEHLRFAEGELQTAGSRLQQAKKNVLAFQTTHKLLDPLAQAQASGTLSTQLEGQLARLEADLRNARSYLNDDSYQVKALEGQVQALRAQIDSERQRATGGRARPLNTLAAEFEALQLQAGFALDAYKLSLGAVENARIEAARTMKSLVVIEPPSKPETAEYPRRIYNILTVLAVCLLLYGVTRLVLATIREHQD